MAIGQKYHISLNDDGKWQVKGEKAGKALKLFDTQKEAIAYAIEHGQPGDIIVLAGKGHEDYQIIGKTKYPFDEKEIVKEFLKQC